MGLAYSLKCSLLCSYFYSLAPLFSFSFPHVLAPRVSLIPPGHITSGILHRPFHPDISHPEFFPAAIPPGRLTSGILLRLIPPGYLISGILPPPTFHPDGNSHSFHPNIHSRHSAQPTFYLIQMSHIRI